jgi:hypothetical protein
MSLVTGKRLSRHQWTKIPMTNAVISAVEAMAEKEGQPLIKGGVPLFEWRLNASVEDFLEEDVELTLLIDRLPRVLTHYSRELKVRGVIRFS